MAGHLLKLSRVCAKQWTALNASSALIAAKNVQVGCSAGMCECCPGTTFTDPEIKFYYTQFIRHDKDKDGKLSRWELNELYREKFGRQLNAADLEKFLGEMGVRFCENMVTFTQYMTHLQKRYSQKYCLQELIQVFDMWDKNSDGLLDWPEFRKAVGFIGYDPDHPDLLCRFQKSDRDVDDKIDFDEFVEAYEALPCMAKRAC